MNPDPEQPTHYAVPIENWNRMLAVIGVLAEGVRLAIVPHLPNQATLMPIAVTQPAGPTSDNLEEPNP